MAHAKFFVASLVTQASSGKSFSTAETNSLHVTIIQRVRSRVITITEKVEPMLLLWLSIVKLCLLWIVFLCSYANEKGIVTNTEGA